MNLRVFFAFVSGMFFMGCVIPLWLNTPVLSLNERAFSAVVACVSFGVLCASALMRKER